MSKVNFDEFAKTEGFKTPDLFYKQLKELKANARNLLYELMKSANLTTLNTDYDVLEETDADYLSIPCYDDHVECEYFLHCVSIEIKDGKIWFNLSDEISGEIDEDSIPANFMVDAYCTALQILTAEDFDYDEFIKTLE